MPSAPRAGGARRGAAGRGEARRGPAEGGGGHPGGDGARRGSTSLTVTFLRGLPGILSQLCRAADECRARQEIGVCLCAALYNQIQIAAPRRAELSRAESSQYGSRWVVRKGKIHSGRDCFSFCVIVVINVARRNAGYTKTKGRAGAVGSGPSCSPQTGGWPLAPAPGSHLASPIRRPKSQPSASAAAGCHAAAVVP